MLFNIEDFMKSKTKTSKPAGKATTKAAAKSKSTQKSSAKKAPVKKTAGASKGKDIVELILADHKPLKKLIKIMKDSDKHDMDERQNAFEEFAPLLVTHAKPEEQVLYVAMKQDDDMIEEGYEGDVEHGLADQLIEEIKRTDDEDLWSARVKVLAELVEHHIEEEEEDMLPDFRKHSEPEDRVSMGQKYLQLKEKLASQGGKDAPSENPDEMEEEVHANY
jgi:hemerythrin superfamily protein